MSVFCDGVVFDPRFKVDLSELDKYYTFDGLSNRKFNIVLFGKGRMLKRYFSRHMRYREVIWFKDLRDLSTKLFIHNVKKLFTNNTDILSVLRLKTSNYYSGCMEDLYKRLQNDRVQGPGTTCTFKDTFDRKLRGS